MKEIFMIALFALKEEGRGVCFEKVRGFTSFQALHILSLSGIEEKHRAGKTET